MKDFLDALNFGLEANLVQVGQKALLKELEALQVVKFHENKFYLNNGFVFGEIDINSKGTGFLRQFDTSNERIFKQDLLIENKDLKGAEYNDLVVCKLLPLKKARPKARVVAILRKANATSVMLTRQVGKLIMGLNFKSGLNVVLKASQKSLKALPLGSVLKIDSVSGEIVEVLGHIDDEKVDEKISLALFDKHDEFSKACLDEARANGDYVDASIYKERLDLRNLAFCTIDPVHAKDFDDAIFYDAPTKTLFVAIADVSEYVFSNLAIDKEARFRGFSIYFPHKAVPMLPRALSENICSLKPNEDRLVFGFKITLDSSGEVLSEELFKGIINSKKRFNYDEVDEILLQKPDLKEFNYLYDLFKMTLILRKKRLKNAFEFRTLELRMNLDEKGALESTYYESDTASHNLIEDCMLLANKAASKLIEKGIFRNHLKADSSKIAKLMDELATLGIEAKFKGDLAAFVRDVQGFASDMNLRDEVDKLIIKAQKKANYESTNAGHFGLGFEHYTHFTSPIRRYSDLTLHRLLKAQIAKDEKKFNFLLQGIDSLCESLSVLERQADKVAWDFMDRKFTRWAKRNLGKTYQALVIENQGIVLAKLDDEIKGANVILTGFANLLSRVEIEITEADIINAKIFGKIKRVINV